MEQISVRFSLIVVAAVIVVTMAALFVDWTVGFAGELVMLAAISAILTVSLSMFADRSNHVNLAPHVAQIRGAVDRIEQRIRVHILRRFSTYAGGLENSDYYVTCKRIFSQPLAAGCDLNLVNYLSKSIFNHRTDACCGINTKPIQQTDKPDTGEVRHDRLVPMYAKEKHPGDFQGGYGAGAPAAMKKRVLLPSN